jgi:hypothetical protein
MFAKTALALALILGTASAALAQSRYQGVAPNHDVYDARGKYLGSDPDANVRHELRRDSDRGRN